jgi:hypothetical protein
MPQKAFIDGDHLCVGGIVEGMGIVQIQLEYYPIKDDYFKEVYDWVNCPSMTDWSGWVDKDNAVRLVINMDNLQLKILRRVV